MVDTVRLTLQLRDHGNTRRVTHHIDVPLKDVETKAAEQIKELTRFFRRERKTENAER
jgi:hypothetical protein